MRQQQRPERGSILFVVLFLAASIAALAALSSSRVVMETRQQRMLEGEAVALNDAYAQLQLAMNVVNTSPYTDENRNIELLDSLDGAYGGTVAGDPDPTEEWLHDPADVLHGKVRGTDVRVYAGRDYIQRLAALRGEEPTEVDPYGRSHNYYVLEALGRAGSTIRLVSALVRENEPFSSFVFFQNQHTLGVSGAPRGLIHTNGTLAFYFPNGSYVDSVSAVEGFQFEAGAEPQNTHLSSANPEATPINLQQVDFEGLKEQSELFVGTAGLDAEIDFYADGRVRIKEFTPPRYADVEKSWTGDVVVGYEIRTVTETQTVQVGTTTEERTRDVIVGYETELYTAIVPVYEEQQVEKTRQVPIYETQTVTCTRWVQVFVPYDEAGGGTAVGGDGGVAGEYQWVEEEYPCQQDVLVGYTTETYWETEQVQVGTTTEERTREVPVYQTETYSVEVPVYEEQDVQVEKEFPIYERQTYTWTEQVFFGPEFVSETYVDLADSANMIYIDGRVTKLNGDLNGRLTLVANEKVRISGSIRYTDDQGESAMLNGDNHAKPYVRNPEYTGDSVFGVIARDDILFIRDLPTQTEINATLLSVNGRVGIDGFAITDTGEPTKNYFYGLSDAERATEELYNKTNYATRRFRKESMRRIGGIISNERILETYIRARSDGTSYVDAGFKRGTMRYDYNLLFNPPPNFVEVPRPVRISVAPVYFRRDEDS